MDSILKYFINEPEREFHIRELAKITKKAPTTISNYLKKMKEKGILNSRKKFNHLLFRANAESVYFKDIKLFYNIKKIRMSGLIDYLNKDLNYPEAIILFGSFAKAENTQDSDIDLLVITPAPSLLGVKENQAIDKFERLLKHKIQLFIYSKSNIEKMKTKNKELLNNLINGVVLSGYWELFI